jgi:hypothetical protein
MQIVDADGYGDVRPPAWDELERALGGPMSVGPRLVLVEWHDAWFDVDQVGPEDARSDYVVRTVGFLLREGPTFLSVAQERLPDDDGYRAVTNIPLAIVERVTDLLPRPAEDAYTPRAVPLDAGKEG